LSGLVDLGDISHEKRRYNSEVLEECCITGSLDPDGPKVPCFPETWVTTNSETRHHLTADPNLHRHCCANLISRSDITYLRMIAVEPAGYTDPSH